MSRNDETGLMEDPGKILGVSADAGDKEIRAAYLKKIRQYPPDRSPVEFEQIRDAYAILRDPQRRMRMMLQSVDPETPLSNLLDSHPPERRFAGPQLWLNAIKEKGIGF
jgi:preprotein translocase subunit Sec63